MPDEFSIPTTTLDTRSELSVEVSRWGSGRYNDSAWKVDEFRSARESLFATTPTAWQEMQDLWAMLVKAIPRLNPKDEVMDSFQINRIVNCDWLGCNERRSHPATMHEAGAAAAESIRSARQSVSEDPPTIER